MPLKLSTPEPGVLLYRGTVPNGDDPMLGGLLRWARGERPAQLESVLDGWVLDTLSLRRDHRRGRRLQVTARFILASSAAERRSRRDSKRGH